MGEGWPFPRIFDFLKKLRPGSDIPGVVIQHHNDKHAVGDKNTTEDIGSPRSTWISRSETERGQLSLSYSLALRNTPFLLSR